MKPLVTTIIPVYNRPSLIQEAVHSVLHQTYRPIEIIIINDGSTDLTKNIINRLAIDYSPLIHVCHQKNAGPGKAREHGLSRATGQYIQYLDSDDILLPHKFERQVEALEQNPKYQICYGKSYEEDHSHTPPKISGPMRSTGEAYDQLFPKLLLERWWTTSSPLYRMSLIKKIGPWRSLKNEEDWEYDARAGALRAPLIWIPDYVSIRRIHITNDHLSNDGCVDPCKLIDRSIAQQSIFTSALLAGVSIGSSEMNQFSRSAFLLSRQCGIAGASSASRKMFSLARQAIPAKQRNNMEFLIYSLMGRVLGWTSAAKLSNLLYYLLKQ